MLFEVSAGKFHTALPCSSLVASTQKSSGEVLSSFVFLLGKSGCCGFPLCTNKPPRQVKEVSQQGFPRHPLRRVSSLAYLSAGVTTLAPWLMTEVEAVVLQCTARNKFLLAGTLETETIRFRKTRYNYKANLN